MMYALFLVIPQGRTEPSLRQELKVGNSQTALVRWWVDQPETTEARQGLNILHQMDVRAYIELVTLNDAWPIVPEEALA